MIEPVPVVELFVEDQAHESFMRALVRRIAREEGVAVATRVGRARGGHGAVLTELSLYQRLSSKTGPDVLVVAIDGNCSPWDEARKAISERIDPARFPRVVIACPDPHVERWYLADPPSLKRSLGLRVLRERRKCERARYKAQLVDALIGAGQITTLGGVEFASEIVDAMDLYRAGKSEPSLRAAINGVRGELLQIGRATGKS